MIQDIYLKSRGKGPPSALGVRSGFYLRLEWSRIYIYSYGPGDKGPPSAFGVRLGHYLRLEWSRKHISQ